MLKKIPMIFFSIFNYDKTPLSAKLLNDGHVLKLLFEWDENQTPFFTGGILGENEYVLDSVDFHWNRRGPEGAEHCYFNNCAKVEMHLIHYNRKYGSFESALNFTDGLFINSAVFEYSFKGEPPAQRIREIISNVGSVPTPGSSVDIEPFVFGEIKPYYYKRSPYLAYLGSLTMPPCTENVLWLLDVITLFIEKEDFALLQSTVELDHRVDHNNRPMQPLNGRTVTSVFGVINS